MSKGVSSKSGKKAGSFTKEVFGMALILFAVLAFFCLVTGNALVYPLGGGVQSFLLGSFGVYSFIFLLHTGLLGFKLVSGKSVIPEEKRLATFLISLAIAIIFLIVHMAVGFDNSLSVGAHMSSSFSKGEGGFATTTPGGAIATLVTAPVAKIASYPGAFVILSIALLVVFAILFRGRFKFEKKEAKPKIPTPEKVKAGKDPFTGGESAETARADRGVKGDREKAESEKEVPPHGYFLDEESPFTFKSKREAASGVPSRLSVFDGRFEFKNPAQSGMSSREPVRPDSKRSYSDDYTGRKGEKVSYTPPKSATERPERDVSDVIRDGKPVGKVKLDNIGVSPIFGDTAKERATETENIDYSCRSAYVVNETSRGVPVVDRTARDTYGRETADTRGADYGVYDRTREDTARRTQDTSSYTRTDTRRDFTRPVADEKATETRTTRTVERETPERAVHEDDFSTMRKPATPSFSSAPTRDSGISSTREPIKSAALRADTPTSTSRSSFTETKTTEEKKETSSFTPRVETSPMGGTAAATPARPAQSAAPARPAATNVASGVAASAKPKYTIPDDGSLSIEDMPVNYRYKAPPLDLLRDYGADPQALLEENEKRKVNSETIVRVIKQSTGIDVTVENIIAGPSVTRYDIAIPDDVSPKDVFHAKGDLAFRLKVSDLRMYNVPNESLIGIEVPNKVVSIVGLKSTLASPEYKALKKKGLQFVLGKNILGKAVVLDLARMPHLLVSGATGMGKSVCLSSLLISLLYRYSPDEMRLIIIDPKVVEFNMYKGIPHLVFNDIIGIDKRALAVLEWAVGEMETRYQFLAENGCKDIGEYNAMIDTTKVKRVPYIVILIDEFADLIMADEKNKKKIENYIGRIAQKARAAGISLILATQRPSVNVISGSIKTNVPSRICFKTATSMDSRVVIDENGAEKLVCKGDCFYKTSDEGFLQRAQGAFVDNPEIRSVLDYIRKNNKSYYDNKVLELINAYATEDEGDDEDFAPQTPGGEVDEVMKKALRIVIDQRRVSNSALRTKLGIGYNRAATIVEWMAKMKYVSDCLDNKDRTVLITQEQYEELYGEFTRDF